MQNGGHNPSFFLENAQTVKYKDQEIPNLHPYEVLVQIKFTGICGSDVHYWKHGAIGEYVVREPMVLGHESSGVVVATGPGVQRVTVGNRVALEPAESVCVVARAATPPVNGTLTQYYAIPEDLCYQLPDHVSLQDGALVEPLSVSVHIAKQAKIKPGTTLVVFGAGPIGLLCCAVAKAFGAVKVVCVDTNQERLGFALKYAATHVSLAREETAEEAAIRLVLKCELDRGADSVIDATGVASCVQTAIRVVRSGGVYVQAGMGKPDITFPIGMLCTKEVVAKGSFRYGPGDYELAISLLGNARVSVSELISEIVPFSQAERAFEQVSSGKGIKTLIQGVGG